MNKRASHLADAFRYLLLAVLGRESSIYNDFKKSKRGRTFNYRDSEVKRFDYRDREVRRMNYRGRR